MPTFDTPEPISVTVEIGVGDIRIVASDRTDTIVEVRPSNEAKKSDVAAAEQTRVEYADGRLLIKGPKNWRQFSLRGGRESIDIRIDLPAGSHVRGSSGVAAFHSTGRLGEVHLTFESEAHLEVREAAGRLRVVYPVADLPGGSRPLSLLAEPPVAVVDANVDRKGTRAVAEEYLRFLDTAEAQELFARNYYRPRDPAVLARHRDVFPEVELFPLSVVAKDWDDAQARFFAEGGVFDRIYQPRR